MPFSAILAGDLGIVLDLVSSLGATASDRLFRRRQPPAADVAVAEGDDAVALAAPDWRRLEDAGTATSPFQTLALAEAASAAHLQRGEIPRIVIAREAGRPVVLLPTVVGRAFGLRTVRFLGDPLIQYGDALIAEDATAAHIETALAAACRPDMASLVHLRRVRAPSRLAPVLSRRCATVGRSEAPFVDLAKPVLRSARDRRELQRLRRRLAEYGEIRLEIRRGTSAAAALLEALALKREWLTGHGLHSRVIGVPEWEAALFGLTQKGGAEGPLAAARLTVGGEPAAVEIGFVWDGCWYSFLGAFVPEFARCGPGQVQMAETMARCAADGLARYDLQPPPDRYKARLAGATVPVHDYALALTVGGRGGVAALRAVPTIKDMIARMPPGLRRIILPAGR